uniref:Takeout/JHBP like protein n=1 Tax=Papilio polytes TaxID=76194 RepID=I4DM21_PAPPL|nr:uncharacterized LOC106103189 precursor [Papilio polytes]BAM18961.1 takeout/JHBP like protein [Papilio polytes]
MFRLISLLLVGVLAQKGYALGQYVPFCAPGDSECFIVANIRHAISQSGNGLPQLGINSIETMSFKNVTLSQGLFNFVFPRMKVLGSKDCILEDMDLSFAQSTMSLTLECPMKITGKYKFSGNIYFYETSQEGNYVIKTDNMRTTINFKIDTIRGADSKRYWKLNVLEYVYEPQEVLRIQLENLFTGEVTKETPFFSPSTGDWWPTAAKTVEPLVSATVGGFHGFLDAFFQRVPLEQLSSQILPRQTYKARVPSFSNLECFSFNSVSDLL